MTRVAEGATLDLLNALEPEAKAAWEADLLTIGEAIVASQAITDRRSASAVIDQNTINVRALPADTQTALPTTIRQTYDPDFVIP